MLYHIFELQRLSGLSIHASHVLVIEYCTKRDFVVLIIGMYAVEFEVIVPKIEHV